MLALLLVLFFYAMPNVWHYAAQKVGVRQAAPNITMHNTVKQGGGKGTEGKEEGKR